MEYHNESKCNDISSYGELENNYLYGGPNSISYFNREIQKCMPFYHKPIQITKSNGTPNFGYSWTLIVDNSQNADFLLNCWLQLDTPEIKIMESNYFKENGYGRWCKNFLHNFIVEVQLLCNDVVISKLDNFSLDSFCQFRLKNDKYHEYMKNIGNTADLTYPSKKIQSKKLFLPLNLFFCNDTGNAIPISALTNTEIKIHFVFRNWENLLILESNDSVDPSSIVPIVHRDIEEIPVIKDAKLFGTFVFVSESERKKLGIIPKTLVIEQIQTFPRQMIGHEPFVKVDLISKNSVKEIHFMVCNVTKSNLQSNYCFDHDKFSCQTFLKNTDEGKKVELLDSACIKYGQLERVPYMPSEYFSYVCPMYYANRIPKETGYYMYSFSLDQDNIDPNGSVNFSRIEAPSLNIKLKPIVKDSDQNFVLVVVLVKTVVIKISEGLLYFPTLN